MKTVSEHIEYVRSKPHHIRKQLAIASAAGGTIFIALVWLIGSLSSGTFSISGDSSFASSFETPVMAERGVSGSQGLAGAGAAAALVQEEDVPAHIEIVDSSPVVPVQKKAEQTTIPF